MSALIILLDHLKEMREPTLETNVDFSEVRNLVVLELGTNAFRRAGSGLHIIDKRGLFAAPKQFYAYGWEPQAARVTLKDMMVALLDEDEEITVVAALHDDGVYFMERGPDTTGTLTWQDWVCGEGRDAAGTVEWLEEKLTGYGCMPEPEAYPPQAEVTLELLELLDSFGKCYFIAWESKITKKSGSTPLAGLMHYSHAATLVENANRKFPEIEHHVGLFLKAAPQELTVFHDTFTKPKEAYSACDHTKWTYYGESGYPCPEDTAYAKQCNECGFRPNIKSIYTKDRRWELPP